MLARAVALLLSAAAVTASAARADAPAPSCSGLTVATDTFATPGPAAGSWLENMGFDGQGGMWVSQLFTNALVRYDATGAPGRSLMVASPGASLLAPDGTMFALYGDSATGPVTPGSAGVVRFDPRAATPVSTPFAGGLTMANGGAQDADGNLYVSDTTGDGVVKLRPDGTEDKAFRTAAPVSSGDGLAIIGSTLYVTQLMPSDSPIVGIPLKDPAAYKTVARLSPGGTGLLLDDLAVGPDNLLYVASNQGKVIRVDPVDGSACLVYSGSAPLNSVRFARGFAPYGPWDAFATSEGGTITHLALSGPATAATPAPTTAPVQTGGGTRPAIEVRARPRRVAAGRRVTLRFRVRSPAPCRAGVRIAGRRTDARGRVRVLRRLSRTRTFVARKAGCRPARVRVRVRG